MDLQDFSGSDWVGISFLCIGSTIINQKLHCTTINLFKVHRKLCMCVCTRSRSTSLLMLVCLWEEKVLLGSFGLKFITTTLSFYQVCSTWSVSKMHFRILRSVCCIILHSIHYAAHQFLRTSMWSGRPYVRVLECYIVISWLYNVFTLVTNKMTYFAFLNYFCVKCLNFF